MDRKIASPPQERGKVVAIAAEAIEGLNGHDTYNCCSAETSCLATTDHHKTLTPESSWPAKPVRLE